MTNLQAAIGVAQMTRIEGFITKKREAGPLVRRSAGAAGRRRAPDLHPGGGVAESGVLVNSVLLADVRASVDEVRARLLDRGIDSRRSSIPATRCAYAAGERRPVAEALAARGLNLPRRGPHARRRRARGRALIDALELAWVACAVAAARSRAGEQDAVRR